MKTDIRYYAALRKSLENERDVLRSRLAQVIAALGEEPAAAASSSTSARMQAPASAPTSRRRRTRGTRSGADKLTMRDAIQQVSSRGAIGIRELVPAMKKLGYRFKSKNPANSLGAYLYGPSGKQHFKKVDGGFVAK